MSWEQLEAIAREAAEWRRQERARRRQSCPNDATQLVQAPDGTLFCTFDGWSTRDVAPGR